MKICWFGIYDRTYPRNDILIRGLKANNVEIIECQADWKDPSRYRILWKKLQVAEKDCDVIYAAYPSNLPVILAKFLTRKPVVMDALYSMYDAVVNDRKEIPWFYPRAIKLWCDDWIAAMLSDYMIVDTESHAAYWSRLPFVKRSKIRVVYTGVQDHIFYPSPAQTQNDIFLVSFHGLYIPLQGVDKIAETAYLLQKESGIKFRFIGSGQLSKKVDEVIKKHNLTNIEQTGRLPAPQVAKYSQEADVILGVFGNTEKTKRVIPNKIYEGMALRKPVITMNTPSVREIFTENDLLLIRNTPEALAEAILRLKNDTVLREKLASNGYEKVSKRYTPSVLGKILLDYFNVFLKNNSKRT